MSNILFYKTNITCKACIDLFLLKLLNREVDKILYKQEDSGYSFVVKGDLSKSEIKELLKENIFGDYEILELKELKSLDSHKDFDVYTESFWG